jgi:hypothetical protein
VYGWERIVSLCLSGDWDVVSYVCAIDCYPERSPHRVVAGLERKSGREIGRSAGQPNGNTLGWW